MNKARNKRGRYAKGDGAYPGIGGLQWNRYAIRVSGYLINELNVSLRSCDLLYCPDAGEQVPCVEINSGFANGASLCLPCVERLAGLLRTHRKEALALGERYDVENPPVAKRYGGGLAMPRHGKMRL